jgi:hypothetical protein
VCDVGNTYNFDDSCIDTIAFDVRSNDQRSPMGEYIFLHSPIRLTDAYFSGQYNAGGELTSVTLVPNNCFHKLFLIAWDCDCFYFYTTYSMLTFDLPCYILCSYLRRPFISY